MTNLGYDYFLEEKTLKKNRLNPKKHLFFSLGGVPCIDANLWDGHKDKFENIELTTTTAQSWKVSKEVFDENKLVFDVGYGRQYYIHKELWQVIEKQPRLPLDK